MEQRLTIRFTQQQWRRLMYLERVTRRSKGAVVRLLLDAAVPTGQKELDVDTRKLRLPEDTIKQYGGS